MKVIKQKELIIFDFEDGKKAIYNMNTGETIGKQGKPVKTLCSALAGYNLQSILDSFEDKKYRDFLLYIQDKFTPRTYNWGHGYQSRVTNLGTLLKIANEYKTLEGYILAGLDVEKYINTPITEVPKGLLKLCRENNFTITDSLIQAYKAIPNEFTVAFNMEFDGINKMQLLRHVCSLAPTSRYYRSNSEMLLREFNYNLKSLLKYIDYLVVFENVYDGNIVTEIADYANMMRQISDKYEKYPRYFLSTHRIAARNYQRLKHQFDEVNFRKRITPEYEITYKGYKFFYPRSTQEIKDEAVQQNNCVASYIDQVISGGCHILFLRKKDEPTKSLVTIEVRDGKIVQARQKYNAPCTDEQNEVIEVFNKKFSKENRHG